jgi:hypothetical protein
VTAVVGVALSGSPVEAVGPLVAGLVGGRDLDRVVLATEEPLAGLSDAAGLRPVGVLRIGAPATTTVPPLTGWPRDLADALRGPVALVGGGHRYDGRALAPLDLDAVSAFAAVCGAAGVGAVAVSGIDAHLNPAHEQRARDVLGDLLGPAVPVLMSHHCGGAGLLERENTTVLGAACGTATADFTERAARSLAAAGVDADLYLVGRDGTVLPAGWVARHPLALLGARHAAARVGAGALSGLDAFTVVEVAPGAATVSAQGPDGPLVTGLFAEVSGVRTSLPGYRTRVLSVADDRSPGGLFAVCVPGMHTAEGAGRRDGAGGVPSAGVSMADLREAVDQVAGGGPVVLVGPGAGTLRVEPAAGSGAGTRVEPAGSTPGGPGDPLSEVRRPERGELAAAFGAAYAQASGSVDRVFFYGEGGREDCVAAARREACELAVRRGADPRTLRVGEVREAAMTYVPVPCVRLRVTAGGPLLSTRAAVR